MNTFMPFAPGPSVLQRNSLSNRFGWKFSLPCVLHKIKEAGFFQPDLLWLDSLFQNYWADLIEPDRMYMRIADHPEHITSLSAPLRQSLNRALKRASLVVTPNKSVASYLQKITPAPIEVVPNGVEVQHFQTPAPVPAVYANESRPKIVFVGSIAHWIDLKLVHKLAEISPDLSFYMIGPHQRHQSPNPIENLHYLGSIDYELIPSYLQHADVALAPFDVAGRRHLVESVDALKLYEYIVSDLPVVATKWEQSQRLDPFVLATEQNPEAFRSAIDQALAYPDQHKASASQKAKFDWSARLGELSVPGLHKTL